MAAFYSLLCKAIKKQPAGRSGRLFWRSGRDSNPRAIARKLISRGIVNKISPHKSVFCNFFLLKYAPLAEESHFFPPREFFFL